VKNEALPPNDQGSCFGRLTKNPQKLETCEELNHSAPPNDQDPCFGRANQNRRKLETCIS
jgi:hypothetical protein